MKNNFYISFGLWIAILPFLGIPGNWRNTLVALSGLFLVLVALGPTILKKLHTKQKPKRKQDKFEFQNQNIPIPNQETNIAESKFENQAEMDKHEN